MHSEHMFVIWRCIGIQGTLDRALVVLFICANCFSFLLLFIPEEGHSISCCNFRSLYDSTYIHINYVVGKDRQCHLYSSYSHNLALIMLKYTK